LQSKKHKTRSETECLKCEVCNKPYVSRSALWAHKKKNHPDVQLKKAFSKLLDTSENTSTPEWEVIKVLVNMLSDKSPQVINNITNITNNNTQFNTFVFLNNDCKNAINIMDFVKQIVLTVDDYVKLSWGDRDSFIKSVVEIFVKNINKLEVNQRPIHCIKNIGEDKTIHVRNDDEWKKESFDDMPILEKAIGFSQKQIIHKMPSVIGSVNACKGRFKRINDEPNKPENSANIIKRVVREISEDYKTLTIN